MRQMMIKTRNLIAATLGLLLLAGCETAEQTPTSEVHLGMTRERLRTRFGEPLRIEPVASGGEDWYYRFLAWRTHPSGETGVAVGTGGTESYVSATVEATKEAVERPIHISPEGFVIEPIPEGKIIKE